MKQMLMRKPASKMAGLTLLETMLAIGVGALIVIAAVIFYNSTKNSQNTTKAASDMNSIVAQAGAYIAPGKTALDKLVDADDAVVALQDVDYLPADLTNPWGQPYTATVATSNTVDGKTSATAATITITIEGLTAADKACKAVAQAVTSTNVTAGTSGCSFIYPL